MILTLTFLRPVGRLPAPELVVPQPATNTEVPAVGSVDGSNTALIVELSIGMSVEVCITAMS